MTTLPVSPVTAKQAYDTIRSYLINCQSYSTQFQTQVSANSIDPETVLNMAAWAGTSIAFVNQVKANSTLASACVTYIQQQVGNATLNVSALFNSITSALQSLINAIAADYPHDVNGNLLDRTFSTVTGLPVWATFTASQFPTTPAAVTAWLATIT